MVIDLWWWKVEKDGEPWACVLGPSARHVAAFLLEFAEWGGGRFTPLGGGKYLMGICNHQFVFRRTRRKAYLTVHLEIQPCHIRDAVD